MERQMNVCIVGCGRIGQKRRDALGPGDRLVAAADKVLERSAALTVGHAGAMSTTDWRAAVSHPEVEAVIVSTTNECLAAVAAHALQARKHVLLEKPGARTPDELEPLLEAARAQDVCVRVG